MSDYEVCDRQGCLEPSAEVRALPDGCKVGVCKEHLALPIATSTASAGFAHEVNLPGVYWHEHYLTDQMLVEFEDFGASLI